MIGIVWEIFKLTGNIDAYLLFKALEKEGIRNGETLRDGAKTYNFYSRPGQTNFVSKPFYQIEGRFVSLNGHLR